MKLTLPIIGFLVGYAFIGVVQHDATIKKLESRIKALETQLATNQ